MWLCVVEYSYIVSTRLSSELNTFAKDVFSVDFASKL